MASGTFEQLSTYPAAEWCLFISVVLILTWSWGLPGALLAQVILFFVVHHSDSRQILSQPGGDLGLPYFEGFLNRFMAIGFLLLVFVSVPVLLFRRRLLRFDPWESALWRFRVLPAARPTDDGGERPA